MLATQIMKSWPRVGAASRFWIALSLRSWLAETVKRLLSHHDWSPARQCSWDYWHGWCDPGVPGALVEAGADVSACAGVTRATALHMAARRGHVEVARALLDCGAAVNARDRKGDTPLQRAIHCRRKSVSELLRERGRASRRAPQ